MSTPKPIIRLELVDAMGRVVDNHASTYTITAMDEYRRLKQEQLTMGNRIRNEVIYTNGDRFVGFEDGKELTLSHELMELH